MWNGMSILYPKSRILIELQREIPVCLPIKRLVPNGSSRFCLHHPLPLCLLREGRLQAPQQTELCFCHAVVFHAVLTVFLKIHVAVQLIDGFIIQPQRLLLILKRGSLYSLAFMPMPSTARTSMD